MKVLDLILLSKKFIENEEGVVITFFDNQMAKCKHSKYLELHGLIGPDAFRANLLIQSILNGTIDDVISNLVPGPKKDSIIEIEEKVTKKFNHLVIEWKELRRKYFNDFREDRKTFAIKHSKDELFGSVMKKLNTSFKDVEKTAEEAIKEFILNKTKKLGDAEKWLKTL